jgi:hypothetical protein
MRKWVRIEHLRGMAIIESTAVKGFNILNRKNEWSIITDNEEFEVTKKEAVKVMKQVEVEKEIKI